MIDYIMNFEAIYMIVSCDKLFSLLCIINDGKVNEYSDILERSCAFYVKKPAIQKNYFQET